MRKKHRNGRKRGYKPPERGQSAKCHKRYRHKNDGSKGQCVKNGVKACKRYCFFKGTSSLVEILLYDENGMYIGTVAPDVAEWSCENGKIEDGFYYPETEGIGKVFATYQNGIDENIIEASCEFNVLGDISAIYPSTKTVKLGVSEKQYISLEGCDKDGKKRADKLKRHRYKLHRRRVHARGQQPCRRERGQCDYDNRVQKRQHAYCALLRKYRGGYSPPRRRFIA
ncbi:MAG: hypothetical protein L6V93_21685 [Clostridiales bacterium]|nr:MAG: hypothetical protein L6V93_21685 [Clostridiales bacterium]